MLHTGCLSQILQVVIEWGPTDRACRQAAHLAACGKRVLGGVFFGIQALGNK